MYRYKYKLGEFAVTTTVSTNGDIVTTVVNAASIGTKFVSSCLRAAHWRAGIYVKSRTLTTYSIEEVENGYGSVGIRYYRCTPQEAAVVLKRVTGCGVITAEGGTLTASKKYTTFYMQELEING